ncbi:NlpC/P60 family protein [Denitromonas sp.]|uniref:NlpC/P60 family protein n=1 Tax=Denitromonas sp. TaxID=2734609 RepID=UPI002AFF0B72|nr:NlpC/P60 family protein [Denitromonas sp.]
MITATRRSAPRPADPDAVVAAARAWLGTPYHDQASLKGVGCDCLGLARGVWRDVVGAEPVPVPPYSRDWGETNRREVLFEGAARALIAIPVESAGPGDMVLFRMRRGAIAKHVGILTASDRFVHSYDRLGVVEEPLTDAWRRRIAFAFRFPRPKRARRKNS